MAITSYTGLPGSGKSHGVFEHVIVPALEQGKRVWTNIPFIESALTARSLPTPTAFTVAEIENNPRWFQEIFESGAVLVLDECWRLWPSGLKANNAVDGHKSFLAEHRHMVGEDGYSTEVCLVTQDLGQLSMFVRQLVDSTYRFVKADKIGFKSRYALHIYQGAVTGQNPPEGKKLRTIPGKYNPEIFKLYKSHTMSKTGDAGDETATDGRNNALKGFKAKAILVGFFVLPVVVVWSLSYVFKQYSGPKESTAPAVSVPANQLPVQGSAPAPRPREKGFLDGKDIDIVFSVSGGGTIDYRLRVKHAGHSTVVGLNELFILGYEVLPVNDCLAVISGHGATYNVMCQDRSEAKGLIAAVVGGTSGESTQ